MNQNILWARKKKKKNIKILLLSQKKICSVDHEKEKWGCNYSWQKYQFEIDTIFMSIAKKLEIE